MVLRYKTSLKSVEERLEFFKKNEFIYLEDIKVLKVKIQIKEIATKELRRKLKVAQKEKDIIQLTVDKLENASKGQNKLIECEIVDNYKKGLGYKSYNAVLPPYTRNFMPSKPDLSYTGLDEFAVKPVVENKSSEEETKEGKPKKSVRLMMDKLFEMELELILLLKVNAARHNLLLLDKQIDGISNHERKYVSSSYTKKILGNMRRIGKGFSRRITPLFPTMVTHKPRKSKRKDTQLPQLSVPTESVADEAVYKESVDSLVRAATTTSSLEAEENNGVIDLKKKKTTQANDIDSLKRRVKKLERRNKSRTHKLIRLYKEVVANKEKNDEVTLAQALAELKTSKPKVKGVVIQDPSESPTTTTTIPKQKSQDKGKGIMVEEHVKSKKKDQIRLDEKAALKLQAEFNEEQRLARERELKKNKKPTFL
nr:hypothetical protein [Tanacetum cinerariifolium]